MTFILVIAAGIAGRGNILYLAGAVIFTGLLLWQHLLVRPDDLSRVNLAFRTAGGVASVVYAVFVILDLVFLA